MYTPTWLVRWTYPKKLAFGAAGPSSMVAVRSHNRFDSGPYLMFYMHATGYTGTIENKEPDKCERQDAV